MADFYNRWLGFWEEAQGERRKARKVIHEAELEWFRTPQDFRIALLCAPETGFRTWGTETMVAEIPAGWHTGKHVHGEEGIFILEGQGFSIIKLAREKGFGKRFHWTAGSTIWIPPGAEHQHFNTGEVPVRYFAIMALHLEHWLGFGKLDQLEEAGENHLLPELPNADSGLDDRGRRIVLRSEDVVWATKGISKLHDRNAALMRPEQGFKNFETQIWGILSKGPDKRVGGKHAHMEAILYVLDGEGYTIVDGERIDWRKGSCLHVQGPQTVHEHFCTGQGMYSLLRTVPGVRINFAEHFAMERFPYLNFTPDGVREFETVEEAYKPGNESEIIREESDKAVR